MTHEKLKHFDEASKRPDAPRPQGVIPDPDAAIRELFDRVRRLELALANGVKLVAQGNAKRAINDQVQQDNPDASLLAPKAVDADQPTATGTDRSG